MNFLWYVIGLICAVWVIVDVLQNQKKMDTTHKVLWIVAAVLFNILTAIIYYFVIKKK